MYYYKVSYKLKDNKTREEFIVLVYCKSEYEKFNRSDLPGAIKDTIYSIGHIEELELHGIEQVSEGEYEKQNSQATR
jgi:hypothetical protein